MHAPSLVSWREQAEQPKQELLSTFSSCDLNDERILEILRRARRRQRRSELLPLARESCEGVRSEEGPRGLADEVNGGRDRRVGGGGRGEFGVEGGFVGPGGVNFDA